MGIEVYTNSGWQNYYDPEIYTSSGWQNILFGEIYTGNGPNSGWDYFYVRINVVDPVITLNSKNQTSITVNVTHSNPDSDLVRVFVYRVGNQAGGQYLPNSSGTTGTVSGTFTQTGLTLGTNYTFRAYAEYLDGSGNVMITSNVTQFTVATDTYNLYTPSTPSLVKDGYDVSGGVYTGRLTATASSNPLYSQNGSASYIQFELTNGFGTFYTLNSSALSNNDSLQSRSVTFTGLGLGTQWICRAKTVYTTISEESSWSAYSSAATTVDWSTVYVPSSSTWEDMQNSSYFTSFVATASSDKSGGAPSNASDGSTSTQWASDPNEITQQVVQQSRNISTTSYNSTFGIIIHDTSSSHNIANPSTTGSTSISTLTFGLAGKCFTDATYIYFEIDDAYSIVRGTATIFGSGLTGVDGVPRSILVTQPVTGGVRQVLFARPSGVPEGQISSSGTMNLGSSGTLNGTSVSSLGGSGDLYYVDSNTFQRFESSNPGTMPSTTTTGTVTYNVVSNVSTPKGAGLETLTLFAAPTGMSSPRRNVKLESVYYRHGTISSSDVDIRVNGSLIASGARSANSILLSSVSSSNFTPTYSSSGLPGGSGWYLQLNVQRGLSGSSYVSTVSEVQLRYSYEVLS